MKKYPFTSKQEIVETLVSAFEYPNDQADKIAETLWKQDHPEEDGFKEFDAHLGWGSNGKPHLKEYGSVVCSMCYTAINFKICRIEFERFEALLNTETAAQVSDTTVSPSSNADDNHKATV